MAGRGVISEVVMSFRDGIEHQGTERRAVVCPMLLS